MFRTLWKKKPFDSSKIEAHLSGFRVLHVWPNSANLEAIEHILQESGTVQVQDFTIDQEAFGAYRSRINYKEAYPAYFKEFGAEHVWIRKQLEHYISFELTHPEPRSVFIDIAASGSPVSKILRDHFGVTNAYMQDLNYPAGIHGLRVGSNADNVPFEDSSVDALLAHNSWEHFEGDSNRGFLVEAARVLKPGGTVCIIPFELRDEPFQVTSPSVWHNKYKNAPALPAFDSRGAVVIDESIRQRLVRYHSPETFVQDIETIDSLEFTVHRITNASEYHFQKYILTGQKRA